MPSDRRDRSGSAGSARSAVSRASSMGLDGGEAGRRMAAEDELIRRELQDPNAFCNSFWGFHDAGYPVVQNRMKSAQRTLEEVRGLYKERAEIEADYAKRLAKLARQNIGQEETGLMRAALDVVRLEVEQTAKTHSDLSSQFKRDLEGQLSEFSHRMQSQRKDAVANIEKLYKQKTTQESYVNKSRDKYEQDCIRINGYTAQSSLVQGRDLQKVTTKLDKAQSTVNSNDKDYQNFVRALKDTTLRWNTEWKAYLDQCQDHEEERLEFMKSNLWNYANAVSAMCVADDQSCERVRVALEQCEAPRDVFDFIHRAGTGSAIPDAPEYINYGRGQPPPARPTFRSANFVRTTTRPPTFVAPIAPSQSTAQGQGMVPSQSMAGRDAHGGSTSMAELPPSQSEAANNRVPPGAVALPGMVPPSHRGDPAASSASPVRPHANLPGDDSMAADTSLRSNKSDKRMSTKNFLARTPSRSYSTRGPGGGNATVASAQSVNAMQPSSSQQHRLPASDTMGTTVTSGTTIIKPAPPVSSDSGFTAQTGADDTVDDDPIAKALADLRMKPSRSPAPGGQSQSRSGHSGGNQAYGSVGRQAASGAPHRQPSPLAHSPSSASHTPNRARSPSAAFMQEPERSHSPLPVEEVLDQYGQSFPGERRSVSRQNSTASRRSRASVYGGVQQPSTQDRARSPGPPDGGGFAGVGARGRSPSPQPFQGQQPPSQQYHNRASSAAVQQQQKPPSQARPGQQGATPQRSATPLGISLDASGSVTHDQMADDFIKRVGSVGPAQGRTMTPQQQPAQHAAMQTAHHQQVQSQQAGYPQYSGHTQQYSTQTAAPAPPVQQAYGYGQAQPQQHTAIPSPYQQPQTPTPYPASHPMGSVGRASQAGPGYQSPSPYNQRPASATAPPPAQAQGMQPQAHQPGYGRDPSSHQHPTHQYAGHQPVGSQYAQNVAQPPPPAETPASAYMHQYQQSYASNGHPAPVQQQPQQAPPTAAAPHQYGQYAPNHVGQASTPAPVHPHGANGYSNAGTPGGHYQQQPQQQQQPGQTVRPTAQQGQPTGAAPPPTGQYSEAGKPILFYVKALYDYAAQMDEEFSFTTGDVIAVWETNSDGWWQGELLDDARRRQGANTFPSNFVSLLN